MADPISVEDSDSCLKSYRRKGDKIFCDAKSKVKNEKCYVPNAFLRFLPRLMVPDHMVLDH